MKDDTITSEIKEEADDRAELLEKAFCKGYMIICDDDPSTAYGLPGTWVKKGKIWQRIE